MSTKKDAQPTCSCGTRSVHKTFVQFEYDYCPKCKKEVTSGSTPAALPFGISALRYEKIITECCNEEVGHLLKDLVANKSMRVPSHDVYYRGMYTGCAQCSLTRDKFERKHVIWGPWGNDETEYTFFIKGRGWC